MLLGSDVTGIYCSAANVKKRQRPDLPPHLFGAKALPQKKVKARSHLHKTFFRWLADNQHRFSLDIVFEKRTDRCVTFSFGGINPAISAHLYHDISVFAGPDDECWDIIVCFEASPKPVPGGYRDPYLLDEYQRLFPDRESAWVDLMFEPFLQWVNDSLAKAHWLEAWIKSTGSSWAKLLMEKEPSTENEMEGYRRILLPCHTDLAREGHGSDK
jgi:hypothetical protein